MNLSTGVLKQGYKDSNLEMTESESVALPFGDSPMNHYLSYCTLSYSILQYLNLIFLNFFHSSQSIKEVSIIPVIRLTSYGQL